MTTMPSNRPPSMQPRPVAAASSGLGFAPIDPFRLLRQYKWALIIAAIVGAVIGTAAHFLIARVYPLWRTEVVYQCLPPASDPVRGGQVLEQREEMERFLLTTSTVLSSDRILRSALVDSPAVFETQTKWGQAWAVDSNGKVDPANGLTWLKRAVSSGPITGTNLVRLTITTQSPEDSAIIARTIHEAFWRDWRALSGGEALTVRQPLEQRRSDLRNQIAQLDAERDNLLRDKRINEYRTFRASREDEVITTLQARRPEIITGIEQTRSRLESYQRLASEGSGTIAYPDEIRELVERDNVIIDLKSRVSNTRSELDGIAAKLGADHPFRQRLIAQHESLENELNSTRESQMRKLFEGEMDRGRRAIEANTAELTKVDEGLNQAIERKQDIVRTLAKFEQLEKDRETKQNQLEETERALLSLQVTQNVQSADRIDRLRLLNPASRPDTIYFPQLRLMIPLGVVATLGLVGGFLFLRELLDQRIKGPSDVFSIPRLRLLGAVPSVDADPTRPTPETAFRDAPTGAIADSYRQIRSQIAKRMAQAGHRSLLVFSGQPGAGASSTASNLALGAAQADQRVLLVDANFRRPSLHRIFKLGEGPGLGEVLGKKVTLDAAVQQTSSPNLHLLSAGSAANRGSPERLSTELMQQVLQEASGKYDLVILDAAPAAIAGDAAALANRVDASLMVIKAMGEKRGLIARLRDLFSESRSEFMGVVVNGVKLRSTGYLAENIRASQEYTNAA
jgi:capsular exopolysaccharide synthesis family protein